MALMVLLEEGLGLESECQQFLQPFIILNLLFLSSAWISCNDNTILLLVQNGVQ